MTAPRYTILGAGRQGTAAAYDLAVRGAAAQILLVDRDLATAEAAAARVTAPAGRPVATARAAEVTDPAALADALRGATVALSAVPYYFNLAITRAALALGVHLVDMGGHTGVVREQLALDAEARAAGVVVLPDCGMGPGLFNVIAVHAYGLLDHARSLFVADGGLPLHPVAPWNYQLAFHINGLTNEYDGTVPLIRDGQLVEVEALSEPLTVDLGPHGRFESFIAAGGSTLPWTFAGRLDRFETRILRYPGHYERFRAYRELGLFREDKIRVGDVEVAPRDVYHALLAPHVAIGPGFEDLCLMHARAEGTHRGEPARAVVEITDRYDAASGFTAMERLTGFHCAMMMSMIAEGAVPTGARALEALLLHGAPSTQTVLEGLTARGIAWTARVEPA